MRGPLREAEGKEEKGGGGGNAPAIDYTQLAAALAPHMEKLFPKPTEKPAEKEGEKPIDDKAKPLNVKESPEFKKLQGDLETFKSQDADRQKKAEEKERTSIVRSALSDFGFHSDKAKDTAFRILKDEIKLSDDGQSYVGPGGEPAEEYIAKQMNEVHDYLLKPKEVGGAGARNGGGRREAGADINSIKPGMKPDDLEAARAEIARVAAQTLRGL